jgi:sugar (glycoside-pentoside-hexuronide) transporter
VKKSAYLGWAIGSFTSSALVSAVGLLHLRFMTDSLGLAIGLAGLLTVLSKVYDAACDPLMGHIGDRTRTRFGKYRPYLLGGGLFAGLSMVLLFNVPSALTGTMLWLWVGMTLLLFSTAYTLFRIPYLALGRAITTDFEERSRLMTFSVYGSSLGNMAATAAAPFLLSRIGSDRAGHGTVAIILGIMIALGGVAAFVLLKERDGPSSDHGRTADESSSFREAFGALRRNRPFVCLIGFKVVLFSGLTVHMAAIPFYTRHVLGVSDSTLGSIFLVQTLAMMASQVLWTRVAARFGRRAGLLAASVLCALAYFAWLFVPAASPEPFVHICALLSGVATGGVFLGLYTVLTDTMDYSRLEQGQDRAGMLAGVFVMVEKGTAAFGTWVFSMTMAWVGFVSATADGAVSQPPSVRTGIVIALSVVPALAAVAAAVIFTRYRLPDATQCRPESAAETMMVSTAA